MFLQFNCQVKYNYLQNSIYETKFKHLLVSFIIHTTFLNQANKLKRIKKKEYRFTNN